MLAKPTASPAGPRSCGMLTASAHHCSAPIAARPIAGTRSPQWAGCYSLFATRCKVTQSSVRLTARGLGAAGCYPCVNRGEKGSWGPPRCVPTTNPSPHAGSVLLGGRGAVPLGGLGARRAFPIHSEPPEGVCEPTRSWACIPPPLKSSQRCFFGVKKTCPKRAPSRGTSPAAWKHSVAAGSSAGR